MALKRNRYHANVLFPRPVPAARDVEFRPWRPGTWVLLFVGAAVLGLVLGIGISLGFQRGPLAPYEYHLWRWEADNVLQIAFARVGIGLDPSEAEGQHAIAQYFALTSQLRVATAAENPDLATIDKLTAERDEYTNTVESIFEKHIDEAVTAEGLQHNMPLFSGISMTWPPPAFKLTSPPQLLVRSPRNIIKRDGDTLLKPGLSLRDAEKIESETDTKDEVSLVVPIGGLAAYPAIVNDDRSYDSLLDTSAHEWTHHYLAFFPLGEQWGKGGDAETLNETTANIAGREIANLIRKAHPLSLPAGQDGNPPAGVAKPVTVDFNKEMHALRLHVDELLKAGKIDEAETAMRDERDFLAQHGINIREINQAYFAFYGTYGDSAASSNPVGPKIEHVWDLTKDVGLFLTNMREVKNVADLDATIARLEAAQRK